MILSVHIPKTGGISFRNIIKEHFADKYAQCYWEITDAWGRVHPTVPPWVECLHGHFALTQFEPLFPDANCITWVRDPVERVISSYFHRLREPDPRNWITCKVHQERLTLAEFVEIPEVQNEMAHFLGARGPQDFDFVGVMEDFDSSLREFCTQFGLPCQSARRDNVNPTRAGAEYAIAPELRRRIKMLNFRDGEIYRRSLELRAARSKTWFVRSANLLERARVSDSSTPSLSGAVALLSSV